MKTGRTAFHNDQYDPKVVLLKMLTALSIRTKYGVYDIKKEKDNLRIPPSQKHNRNSFLELKNASFSLVLYCLSRYLFTSI